MSNADSTLAENRYLVGSILTKKGGCHFDLRNPGLLIYSVDSKNIWCGQDSGKALCPMTLSSQKFFLNWFWHQKWSYAFLFHLSTSGILLEALTKHILFVPAWVCRLAFSASTSLSKVWKQWYVLSLKCPFFLILSELFRGYCFRKNEPISRWEEQK